MVTTPSTIQLPTYSEQSWLRTTTAIRSLAEGRSLAVGTVTLTANVATTVVTFTNCSQNSKIFLSPTTANAAAEVGAGTLYVSSVGNGTFTLTHANNAQTDRTFAFVALG